MLARILLADGTILEIQDADSVLQMNRRRMIEGKDKAVKIPYQVSVLCEIGNMNGKIFDYDDVLKIELLFPPSEHRRLLKKD